MIINNFDEISDQTLSNRQLMNRLKHWESIFHTIVIRVTLMFGSWKQDWSPKSPQPA